MDFNGLFPAEIMTYESNIAYTMRFMIDTKVSRQTRSQESVADCVGCRDELGGVQGRQV